MRRNTTDTLSLIFGLFFATLAVVWLVDEVRSVPRQAVGMIFGGVFLLVGTVGLIRAIRRPRSEETDTS